MMLNTDQIIFHSKKNQVDIGLQDVKNILLPQCSS